MPKVVADIAGITDRGRVRSNNEDCFTAVEYGRHLRSLVSSLSSEDVPPFEQGGYGMVVADGLGGMAAGEVASQMAVKGLLRLVEDTPDWILFDGKGILCKPGHDTHGATFARGRGRTR